MAWMLPNEEAVTLGEMDGELISILPRDEAHVGDVFVRRGGAIFTPARVVSSNARQPFGRHESLTSTYGSLDDQDVKDPRAFQLAKQAFHAAKLLLVDDEHKLLQSLWGAVRGAFPSKGNEEREEETGENAEVEWRYGEQRKPRGEMIKSISWHPYLSVLAVARADGIVALYDLQTSTWDARVLQHPSQTAITSIKWAKCAAGKIAVAARCVFAGFSDLLGCVVHGLLTVILCVAAEFLCGISS